MLEVLMYFSHLSFNDTYCYQIKQSMPNSDVDIIVRHKSLYQASIGIFETIKHSIHTKLGKPVKTVE